MEKTIDIRKYQTQRQGAPRAPLPDQLATQDSPRDQVNQFLATTTATRSALAHLHTVKMHLISPSTAERNLPSKDGSHALSSNTLSADGMAWHWAASSAGRHYDD